MSVPRETWFDEEAGPLVRSYAVTGGRTRSGRFALDLITLVVALHPVPESGVGEPEHARILGLCQQPASVAEVAARVDLPLPVVKVLLSDLIERNLVLFRTAAPASEAPSQHVLQAVLDGIRKL
ncbi:DUF742 domain-containing protein [Amycolatopsis sp. PS_44_ISF1]|uniref:DUF742 domain-containing protein n=1 Tax=Amycolatopsis sp. PS_44_ISF1 TaxID=2974917 RepID=UPI0028DF6933|nr:DUF742 domain-containing protein [Amycolatopsis sp. PS_44_ISF1]MDT8911754.1 DUF742 domain-containing protein [Amycolatopsis sp. PS_44_ISF1]